VAHTKKSTIQAFRKVFAPSERLIAVDVGSRTVKIAEFRKRKDRFEVITLDAMTVPFSSSKGDVSPQKITETLQKLLQKHGIRSGDFVSLLSREFVTIKQFELPTVLKEQIAQMIPFEAEKHLPFSVERAILDFDFEALTEKPAEEEPQPEPQSEQEQLAREAAEILKHAGQSSLVTLAGVRQAVIPKFLELLKVKGFRQRAIDVSSFGLHNAFGYYCREHPVDAETGDPILIDIGARRAEILVLSAETGRLLFTRAIDFGGDMLTEYIAQQEELSFEEAERRKCEQWETTVLADRAVLRTALEPFLEEIGKILKHVQRTSLSLKPGKIWLSGGTAVAPGLPEILAELTGQTAEVFDPVAMLGIKAGEYVPSSCMAVIGCALRCVNEALITIDLLPVDITKLQQTALRKRRMIQLGVAVGVLVVFGMSILGGMIMFYSYRLTTLTEQVSEVTPVRVLVTQLEKRNEQLEGIVGKMEELTDRKTSWSQVLQTIAECMNSNVWVKSVQIRKDNQMILEISSLEISHISFTDELKKRLRFENVKRSDTVSTSKNGKDVQDVRIYVEVLPDLKYEDKLKLLLPASLDRAEPPDVTGAARASSTLPASMSRTGSSLWVEVEETGGAVSTQAVDKGAVLKNTEPLN